jgi:hypothetical protein
MSTEAWLVFGGLALTVFGGFLTGFGRFIRIEAKVDAGEKRAEEERLKNTEQHKEFYEFRRETEPVLAEILQQLTGLAATQNRMESKIDDIERRIK